MITYKKYTVMPGAVLHTMDRTLLSFWIGLKAYLLYVSTNVGKMIKLQVPRRARCNQYADSRLAESSFFHLCVGTAKRFEGNNRLVRKLVSSDKTKAANETLQDRRPSLSRLSEGSSYIKHGFSTSDCPHLAPKPKLSVNHENHRVSASSHTLSVDSPSTPLDSNQIDISTPSPESTGLNSDLSRGYDILVRLPGDEPGKTKQMVASIDTQCTGVNLMRSEIWFDRLNEDGRGRLEPVNDEYVTTLGSESIQVIGIARGLEWHFKNGARTYKSDFHIVKMHRFDVLLGSTTIREHGLLQPGADLRRHLEKDTMDDC
jgi:hypothetical protein